MIIVFILVGAKCSMDSEYGDMYCLRAWYLSYWNLRTCVIWAFVMQGASHKRLGHFRWRSLAVYVHLELYLSHVF